MRVILIQGYCPGCRRMVRRAGWSCASPYCCDDCRGGACTCRGMHPVLQQDREERLRDVYRIA